jgi:tRNA-Thr(GGU) m(6)t(6)A37 methyltransferase TsaA
LSAEDAHHLKLWQRLARIESAEMREKDRLVRSARRGRRQAQDSSYLLEPVGFIRSALKRRKNAPRQGAEGAPDAWLEISRRFAGALPGINVGEEIIVLTWFHQARRDVQKVHPRGNKHASLVGVFATRSPDRPNPIGLHRVTVQKIVGTRYKIGPIEAIDGTPIVDIKPVLERLDDS